MIFKQQDICTITSTMIKPDPDFSLTCGAGLALTVTIVVAMTSAPIRHISLMLINQKWPSYHSTYHCESSQRYTSLWPIPFTLTSWSPKSRSFVDYSYYTMCAIQWAFVALDTAARLKRSTMTYTQTTASWLSLYACGCIYWTGGSSLYSIIDEPFIDTPFSQIF